MLPRMKEFVIDKDFHLCMEKFPTTKCEKQFLWTFPASKLCGKVHKFIGQLSF